MANNGRSEKKILDMIVSDYSWEQVLYKVIAWEGLDPWNLDIIRLSEAFATHIADIRELDFRLPAKYILIASVLLRMKSDYIRILKEDELAAGYDEFDDMESGLEGVTERPGIPLPQGTALEPIQVPARRRPTRRVVVTDLVAALRRALGSSERREKRMMNRGHIEIGGEDIGERIERLYGRIGEIMNRMKKEEVTFSGLVKRWERGEIIETFMPLLYLEHQKRVNCRQEELFKEIFIRKQEELKKKRAKAAA